MKYLRGWIVAGVIAALQLGAAWAQSRFGQEKEEYFRGAIGKKMFMMRVQKSGDAQAKQFKGAMFYDRQKKEIPITGSWSEAVSEKDKNIVKFNMTQLGPKGEPLATIQG